MLTVWLVLAGALLVALVLAEPAVRRLPLSPAVLYLLTGWGVGAALGGPSLAALVQGAPVLLVATEAAVLVSLFAVGLRLGVPDRWRAWRAALVLAGPGMVATIVGGAAAAHLLLDLDWPLALLLAAVLAPTDPVLASEVQIRSRADRDAVRLTITAEGGLNDGSALPAVLGALALASLHRPGAGPGVDDGAAWPAAIASWAWHDLAWPIAGGVLLGVALGRGLGRVLRAAVASGNPLRRDEWLYAGAVLLGFGLARATGTSTFVVVFVAGVVLLHPSLRSAVRATSPATDGPAESDGPDGPDDSRGLPHETLGHRLGHFGERVERLVEATLVIGVGLSLHALAFDPGALAFALVLVLVVRPLTAWLAVQGAAAPGMTARQRRLVAWFGIRGIGTLYYAAFAIEHGIVGPAAEALLSAVLTTIAVSVVLHGVSATPLMLAYRGGGGDGADGDPPASG